MLKVVATRFAFVDFMAKVGVQVGTSMGPDHSDAQPVVALAVVSAPAIPIGGVSAVAKGA